MALTPSNISEPGVLAPKFILHDTVSGNHLSLEDVKGKQGTVVMFICNHCPYVLHVKHGLGELSNDYQSKGIGFVAISSNDISRYPQDGPKEMKEFAEKMSYTFPYLYDETQEVAKAYDAACTPDLYVLNSNSEIIYRGQLDDSRPGNDIPVTGESIRAVLDTLLAGEEYTGPQKPSIGCSIKWK